MRVASTLPLLLLWAAPLFAQGVIAVDPDAVFERKVGGFDEHPEAEFEASSSLEFAVDYLNEAGWWYRLPGDAAEQHLPTPSNQNYSAGTSSLINWFNLESGAFHATEVTEIERATPLGVAVTMALTIVNIDEIDPLTISIFHMVEPFLRSNALDDAGKLAGKTPAPLIRVTDSEGPDFFSYAAGSAIATYSVGSAVDTSGPGGRLRDDDVDNFTNTGLPYVPTLNTDNISLAFQFDATIPPSGQQQFLVRFAANLDLACGALNGLLCDGFETGNRSIWSASVP